MLPNTCRDQAGSERPASSPSPASSGGGVGDDDENRTGGRCEPSGAALGRAEPGRHRLRRQSRPESLHLSLSPSYPPSNLSFLVSMLRFRSFLFFIFRSMFVYCILPPNGVGKRWVLALIVLGFLVLDVNCFWLCLITDSRICLILGYACICIFQRYGFGLMRFVLMTYVA